MLKNEIRCENFFEFFERFLFKFVERLRIYKLFFYCFNEFDQ